MNPRLIPFYMNVAEQAAQLSRAQRAQVGCVIVKNDNIISFSWNGMPRGWDNCCEYEEEVLKSEHGKGTWLEKTGQLKTKPEVLHAERNSLDKLARSRESGYNASMFITHSPCLECAKSIYGAGIREVYYKTPYRDRAGIDFLEKCGVKITKIDK